MLEYSVVITTAARAKVLTKTVKSILSQNHLPQKIILVLNHPEDREESLIDPRVEAVIFDSSNSAKRNYGARQTPDSSTILLFLDDDVELHRDYAKNLCAFFQKSPKVIAITGHIVKESWISREEAKSLLLSLKEEGPSFRTTGKHWVLHGCNMGIRRRAILVEGFDENLPLYSFGEDYEVSIRLARMGMVGRLSNAYVIHLKAPGGRLNRKRLAWSIMANNYYFLKKGSIHTSLAVGYLRFIYVYFHIGREQFLADLKAPSSGFPGSRGILLSLIDLVRGKLHPSRLTEIE